MGVTCGAVIAGSFGLAAVTCGRFGFEPDTVCGVICGTGRATG